MGPSDVNMHTAAVTQHRYILRVLNQVRPPERMDWAESILVDVESITTNGLEYQPLRLPFCKGPLHIPTSTNHDIPVHGHFAHVRFPPAFVLFIQLDKRAVVFCPLGYILNVSRSIIWC